VSAAADERRGIYLGRIDRPAEVPGSLLLRSDSGVVYAPTTPGTNEGTLFSVVDGRIEARQFDHARLRVANDARTIDMPAGSSTPYHTMMMGASAGVVAFSAPAVPFGSRLQSVERDGSHAPRVADPEAQNWPRLSPDGRRLARQRIDTLRNNADIWVDDLERGTSVRITMDLEPDIQPVWSPDGRYLAYVTGSLPGRPGTTMVRIAAADGTGVVRTFPCPAAYCEPSDWNVGGRILLNVRDSKSWDIWTASPDGAAVERLLGEPFSERDARFSPNGRWIAYVSEESGRSEVSVRSVAGPPGRIVLSGGGGAQPVWRRDGGELFFVDLEGRLSSVSVQWAGGGTPRFGLPTRLNVPSIGFGHWGTQYDVSPDGSRVYSMHRNLDHPPRDVQVVMGWRALLAR
jgi:Tol biopolymer transport system component